jgi:hypothetical protein
VNSNELLSKASNQGINRVRDTKIAGALLPQISLILAAAHFKSVNIIKRIARLFGRIVIVSQNYCAIFVSSAQQVGICLIKVLTQWPENARLRRRAKGQ